MTPSECEACFYLTDNFGHGHTVLCWTHVDALHAEIAELRAILWQIATDPLQKAELREAVADALAPKSSAGGGGV